GMNHGDTEARRRAWTPGAPPCLRVSVVKMHSLTEWKIIEIGAGFDRLRCARSLWVPGVGAGEDVLQRVLGGLVGGELARPLDPRVRVGAGAGGLELGEAGGFFPRGVAPVVPAGGFDERAHFA